MNSEEDEEIRITKREFKQIMRTEINELVNKRVDEQLATIRTQASNVGMTNISNNISNTNESITKEEALTELFNCHINTEDFKSNIHRIPELAAIMQVILQYQLNNPIISSFFHRALGNRYQSGEGITKEEFQILYKQHAFMKKIKSQSRLQFTGTFLSDLLKLPGIKPFRSINDVQQHILGTTAWEYCYDVANIVCRQILGDPTNNVLYLESKDQETNQYYFNIPSKFKAK
jgi:hypothetical protein